MSKTESLHTPKEWLTHAIYANIEIMDCDGWTGEEWDVQTPLSQSDFEMRLAQCTISLGCHNA